MNFNKKKISNDFYSKGINSSSIDQLGIYDTTLRDGEQSIGVTFTPEEKISIARMLENMGVDRIEAGFPLISKGDREAIIEK